MCSPLSNSQLRVCCTCLLGALEPGVLRPYRHVLQRGGRRAPTPLPHHAVDPGPHAIILGCKGEALWSLKSCAASALERTAAFTLKDMPVRTQQARF